MIDQLSGALLNILLFNALLLPFFLQVLYKSITTKNKFYFKINDRYLYIIIVIILLFCLFSLYGGDYYHYYEFVKNISTNRLAGTHMEPIYIWIADLCNGNYILFRLLIWGSALLFLCISLIRLHSFNKLTFYFFILTGLLFFAYPRVSLGISLLFLGFTFIINNKRNFLNCLLGICLITLSYYTHKSMFILIAVSILSLFNLKKTWFILLILVLPIVIYIVNIVLPEFYLNFEDDISGLHYLERETKNMGISKIIRNILIYTPLYGFIFFLIYKLKIKPRFENKEFPAFFSKIYNLVFWIFYVSTIFLFLEKGSNAIYYRVLYMIFIPLSIVLSIYFRKYSMNKFIALLIMINYFAANYWLLYSLYLAILSTH